MGALSLRGTLTLEDGTEVELLVDTEDASVAWGADPEHVARTVDIREAIADALREEERR
ncbi:hypothetical protein [Microbacterium phage MO526]|uniref:Uncharacterized protein n=1 Tax=Microbacterium phage MO526 TaxID=3108092 RepID=A0ABZ0ZXK3_9CAUD|nr:hypothetical protein [Microbacterium phage MO526]